VGFICIFYSLSFDFFLLSPSTTEQKLAYHWLLIDLTDYDGVRLTSQNSGHHWPIVHPPGECEWRAVVVVMTAGDNA
jgi:hypothetical protein